MSAPLLSLVTSSLVRTTRRIDRRLISGGALLLALGVLLPLPVDVQGSVAWAVLLLPGALLALLLFEAEHDLPTRCFLGCCGGVAVAALLVLALQAIPGPLPWWLLLATTTGASMLFGALLLRRSAPTTLPPPRVALLLGGVLLVAAALRLLSLGASEVQGDEGCALLMALGVWQGQDDVLLLHKKGPAEVLLPAAPLILTQHLNEWSARLPFALASIGVVLGGFVLGARMLADEGEPRGGAWWGLLAAAFLAVEGFGVGFGRIVQYQSVLLLLCVGAVWCAWRFCGGASQRYLTCAALLASVALLAHYDALSVMPVLAWLAVAGGRRRGWHARQWLIGMGMPALLGGAVVASFYVPFVLHEHFAATTLYLSKRFGSSGVPGALHNNLPDYLSLAAFYNTTFFVAALVLAFVAGLITWLVQHCRPRVLGGALAALLMAACAVLLRDPALFQVTESLNLAGLAFGLPLADLILAPATPAVVRALLLWFSVSFLTNAFIIGEPRTHFYTMVVRFVLLATLAMIRLLAWLRARRLALLVAPLSVGIAAVLLLSAPYAYLVFARQFPEYTRSFPKARPAIYRASYGDRMPGGGSFGFPRHSGWKVIGDLYERGVLHGSYAANDEELIVGWYARGVLRCDSDPAYYFLAKQPYDPIRLSRDEIMQTYHLLGYVGIGDDKTMEIFSRAPVDGPPQVFALEDHADSFDAQPLASFPTRKSLFEFTPMYRTDATWANGMALRGYDLDRQQLAAGQVAHLTLAWHAPPSVGAAIEPFVDVLDQAGRVVGRGAPVCQRDPAAAWPADNLLDTAFALDVSTDMSPGVYTIQAGLRQRDSGSTVALADSTTTLRLAPLTVIVRK